MAPIRRPTDLTLSAWWQALRDAALAFRDRELTDNAAALTYYSVLSLFPGLIVLISLLGLLGSRDSIDGLLRIVEELGSESAVETLRPPIENIVANSGEAGVALVVGTAAGLWTASGYIGAFIRTANKIYATRERRPFWLRRPFQLLITLVLAVIAAIVLIALVVSGPLAEAIGAELGIGDTALAIWSRARWPLLFAVVVFVLALLYRIAPDARHQGLAWILPGSLVATSLWLIGSLGFSFYVTNFGSFAGTYGSLAGVIVLLIWLWVTNVAIVFGAQFAADLERTAMAARAAAGEAEFAPFVDAEREAGTGG